MSKCRFVGARISILISKIISGHLEASNSLQLFSWLNIIFDVRIEILILTNIHLDIHEGILEVTSISVPGQPPDILKGILEFDLQFFSPEASMISLHQPPGGQILFLICELKSWPLQTYIQTHMKAYQSLNSISVSGQPPGSASNSLQLV